MAAWLPSVTAQGAFGWRVTKTHDEPRHTTRRRAERVAAGKCLDCGAEADGYRCAKCRGFAAAWQPTKANGNAVTFTGTIRVPLEDKIDYVTVELFNTVKHQRDERDSCASLCGGRIPA